MSVHPGMPAPEPSESVDPGDLVLLILGAPAEDEGLQGRCNGITRLEKLAFLLEKETDFVAVAAVPTEGADFRAYHYGPYSQKIYDAVAMLASIGLLVDRRVSVGSALDSEHELDTLDWSDLGASGSGDDGRYVERQLELTDKGRVIAELLSERVGPRAVQTISSVKDRYGAQPLNGLLRYVYAEYPEQTVKSRIRDKF